ncbi:hypothetical protein OM076_16500 [Solirubrobacter ginsenosidimutans]|uniref:DUF11 domain-containing protein n=1 Tax=Solirubrobacter ginsenosidimutans TaxID=490573 RepID=A0A9X3MU10_9ACTN|nr:hypothetical protein [Solirubrobacter ginsenosidimutans]MDA0161876.1 hypothetical protein [Solirubrobacter ginsenosidimutans]
MRLMGTAVLLGACLLTLLVPAGASADRPFAVRYTVNDAGSITFAANTLMTCPAAATGCAAAQAGTQGGTLGNNNGYAMTRVDVDGVPGTFDSSSADLSLPADALVLWAGLYWAGDTAAGSGGAAAPSPAARNTVSLRAPGAGAYTTITAQTLDTNGSRFSGFAEVTAQVRAAGVGAYTVANVQAATGEDRYAAWDLIVVYRDATEPPRNLTVFDGLATISRSTPAASVSLSGFTTPPFGPVRSTVGLWSSEGDRTSTGDSATLNSSPIFDPANPADNVFNSSISRFGVNVTDKNPNYVNQLGSDMNLFREDGVLANGATSATIRLTTGGETYYPAGAFFTTDIFAPEIRPVKSVVDVNGGAIERGDQLEYTVRLTNTGQDPAVSLRFLDPIPAQTAYVPNSLAVTPVTSPGGACGLFVAQSDAINDGLAEYDPAAGRTVFRLGTGANDTQGGRLEPGQTACARFRVGVAPDAQLSSAIVNQGAAAFVGLTLGTQFPEELSNATTSIVAGADLVPAKTHAGGVFVGGRAYNFTIGVANAGNLPTTGTVTVQDPLDPAQFSSVNSAAGAGWACTIAASTVTCTRPDPLPAGQSYPPIVVNATVQDPAPATVVNTATVSGGGDSDDTNNSATDAGGATAQADLTIAKAADQRVVPARGEVTFTLDVLNRGPSTATAAQVTDTLTPNFAALEVTSDRGTCTTAVVCTLGAMAPGQAATITIRARVLDAAVASTVTNAATVTDTGTSEDPAPGNNRSEVDLDVPVSSDLQVDKSFAPTPNPTAGDLVTYTIAVSNAGPSTAHNVSTRDVLPAEFYAPAPVPTGTFTGGGTCVWLPLVRNLRCAIDSLAPGQTETITIVARLAPDSRGKTVLNNIGAISDSVDPNPALATDTVSFVPIPAADLELTKAAPPDPVTPGGVARFTFQVANHGPSSAPDVMLHDTLPDGLTFVADTAGACSAAGQAVTCALGALSAGGSLELGIDVRVDPSKAGQTVRNTASIASEPADPALAPAEVIPSSNFDSAALSVAPLVESTPPEPAPPVPVAAPAQPSPAQVVTQCPSLRRFTIRLRERKGRAVRSAAIRVNGRVVAIMRRRSDHRLVAVVDLRGLPKGTYQVEITARLRNGRRARWVRSYRTCIDRLPPSNHLTDRGAL